MAKGSSVSGATTHFTVVAAPTITAPADNAQIAPHGSKVPVSFSVATSGVTVTLLIDGIPDNATTATAGGTGTILTSAVPTDGTYAYQLVESDGSGHDSDPGAVTHVTIDAIAPAKPTITSPPDGASSTDNRPAFAVSTEASAVVTLWADGANVGTATAASSGIASVRPSALAAHPLSEGSHTVSVTATDSVGNVSVHSDSRAILVDTVAPGAPAPSSPAAGATVGRLELELLAHGAAVATVEQQHDRARIAIAEQAGEPRRADRRRKHAADLGVSHRQAQPAAAVELAVACVEDQDEVVPHGIVDDVLDRGKNLAAGPIEKRPDLEVAALRIAQHRRQALNVVDRPPQVVEAGVGLKRAVADQEGDTSSHRRYPDLPRARTTVSIEATLMFLASNETFVPSGNTILILRVLLANEIGLQHLGQRGGNFAGGLEAGAADEVDDDLADLRGDSALALPGRHFGQLRHHPPVPRQIPDQIAREGVQFCLRNVGRGD